MTSRCVVIRPQRAPRGTHICRLDSQVIRNSPEPDFWIASTNAQGEAARLIELYIIFSHECYREDDFFRVEQIAKECL